MNLTWRPANPNSLSGGDMVRRKLIETFGPMPITLTEDDFPQLMSMHGEWCVRAIVTGPLYPFRELAEAVETHGCIVVSEENEHER